MIHYCHVIHILSLDPHSQFQEAGIYPQRFPCQFFGLTTNFLTRDISLLNYVFWPQSRAILKSGVEGPVFKKNGYMGTGQISRKDRSAWRVWVRRLERPDRGG